MPGSGTLTPVPHTGQGALLGVLPVNGGSQHLAIVGYLLPAPPVTRLPLPAATASGGALVVEPAQRRVLVGGRDAGLVFREYELLVYLADHPGRVFTREHLLETVWDADYEGTIRTVDVHVHRLRRKLGPGHGSRLVTVRRVGYLYQPAAPRV
jgi:hypothetical protein